jgi:hypothetical protein
MALLIRHDLDCTGLNIEGTENALSIRDSSVISYLNVAL